MNTPRRKPKIVRKKVSKAEEFSYTRRNFWKILILVVFFFTIFLIIATVHFYNATDLFVQKNLENLAETKTSAIYSEPFMIFKGQKISSEALKRQIDKRQYVPSIEDPSNPGDYMIKDSILIIYSRRFLQPNGEIREAAKIVYNFESGDLKNLFDSTKDELVLEPIAIATLGTDDVRASVYKRLDQLPKYLPNAFIAIEDQRFYKHIGIDPFGIIRAMARNISSGHLLQGGSTITQQLAKNLFFTSQKSILRKINEAFAAISLERHLSKEKILEMYLNEVYFGRDGSVSVHGVSEAALTFLGKPVEQITISEAALLAGMVKAPSSFALRKNLDKAVDRRDIVLASMKEESYITEQEYQFAKNQKITVSNATIHKKLAPHFITQLESELGKAFDIDSSIESGLSVFTGIDREYQQCAEKAVADGIEELEKTHPSLKRKNHPLEGALVSIEPFSGLIKSWVGGRDFSVNQFNHVSQASRQIGSTIKPFVYLTALSPEFNSYKVATTVSILSDEPISIKIPGGSWSPQNYDKKFRGDVTVRYALENSLNVPAVYISQKVGIPKIVDVLKAFHVSDHIDEVPSLALGAVNTTLLRMTSAYAALANGGRYIAPRLFSSVLTKDGTLAMSASAEEEIVASEGPVYILTNIMQGVVDHGTARGVRTGGFNGIVAGKTGTTNDARDAWFIGFTSNLSTGVWVGFDDNKKIGLTGGIAAVPIWTHYMKCISPYFEDLPFLAPPSVETLNIDNVSNKVIDPKCPVESSKQEVFLKGTEPKTTCESSEEPAPSIDSNSPVDDSNYQGFPEYEDQSKSGIAEDYEKEQRKSKSFWDSIF